MGVAGLLNLVLSPLAVVGCGGGGSEVATPARSLNLLLVSVDSLRADHVGAYGYDRPTTPFFDSLAERSVLFERAYAPSSHTMQSVSAVLSGRLPTSGGSIGLLEAQPSEQVAGLGTLFRRAGWVTGLFTNQPLLRGRGFTRGFEDVRVAAIEQPLSGIDVTDLALRFVDDSGDGRFAAYVHLLDPHQPYTPEASYLERFDASEAADGPSAAELLSAEQTPRELSPEDAQVRALVDRYDAEIAYTDDCLRRLIEGLEARGRLENTVVVLTSTHGEELLDHGYLSNSWTLYEEVLRVPLLLFAPALFPAERVAEPVSTVDLLPTLVTLFGLEVERGDLDGQSLLHRAGGELRVGVSAKPRIAELVIRERTILRAVVDGSWKYVGVYLDAPFHDRRRVASSYHEIVAGIADGELETPDLWGEPIREELYDLAADPGELSDLSGSESERLAQLRQVLLGYERYCLENSLEAARAVRRLELDTSALRDIEALGYL